MNANQRFLYSHATHGPQGEAHAQSMPGDDHIDDYSPDTHRNAPQPDSVCLYGLVGDVAKAGSDGTEANPYAIAANFMAYLSCAIGRGPYLPVGDTWHHARLYVRKRPAIPY